MKKLIVAIVCTTILSCFYGCKNPSSNIPHSFIDATAQVTDPAVETENTSASIIARSPMISVSLPTTTEKETAPDGTLIYNHTYQNMSLIVPDPEVADKIIIDFLNRVDKTAQQADTIRSAAKKDHDSGILKIPYLCQIIYEPERLDNSVLSLFGRHVTYSGAIHPESLYQSVNYDLLTGEVLTLSHIMAPETEPDTLCRLIVDALNKQKDIYLYEGFEAIVQDRLSHGFASEKCWYFSTDGLCFYFSPYEIAPYSTGVVIAQIPYNQLTGILGDSYFPAERETAFGSLFVDSYNEEILESYSQFAELILDENGEMILIHTDKSVYDIRLNVGYEDGEDIAYTAFAAYGLSPGDAVTIQTPMDKQIPLCVSYRTNDTIQQYNIHP